jgi:16S rRNA C967 or C1407 C5-methylase (RsmB/RsmF family)
VLVHNLAKLGCGWVRAWNADVRSPPRALAANRYRHILVDPPCTGSGTLVPARERTWRHLADRYEGYVAIKAAQQLAIATAAAALLAPGGSLVYSTCSIDPEENEAVVDALLARHPQLALEDATTLGTRLSGNMPPLGSWRGRPFLPVIPRRCLRLLPGVEGEGFFVAWLRRVR